MDIQAVNFENATNSIKYNCYISILNVINVFICCSEINEPKEIIC